MDKELDNLQNIGINILFNSHYPLLKAENILLKKNYTLN